MIDWKRTEVRSKVGKEYFDIFPKSGKKVLRICEKCGNEKWIKYVDISDGKFCIHCVASNEKSKINRSIAQKKHHTEHPERSIKQGITRKKHFDEHPEMAENISKRQIKRYENIEERLLQSDRGKKYHTDHPEVAKEQGKKISGGNDIVNHHIAYDFNNPELLTVKVTRKRHGQIHHIKGFSYCEHTYSLID